MDLEDKKKHLIEIYGCREDEACELLTEHKENMFEILKVRFNIENEKKKSTENQAKYHAYRNILDKRNDSS